MASAAFGFAPHAAEATDAKSAQELSGKIYFLTPNTQVTRFEAYDKARVEAALKKYAPNVQLVMQSADNSPARQLEQAQAAVTEGALAIILSPPVPNQSQSVVAAAKEAGIPVVNYAYQADASDIDYYVTVPFEPIGEKTAQFAVDTLKDKEKPIKLALIEGDPSLFFDTEQKKGMDKILQPLVADGTVKIVCRSDNLQLSEENARIATEGCFEQAPDGIDGILVHNDSSANGVLAALAAEGSIGEIKVFGGYDSQAGTIQHLLAGNIESDMVPPYSAMAESAVKLIVGTLTNDPAVKDIPNGTRDNGFKQVPTVYNENIFITRDNVQKELIDTGILTKEEVCAGPAVSSDFCAK